MSSRSAFKSRYSPVKYLWVLVPIAALLIAAPAWLDGEVETVEEARRGHPTASYAELAHGRVQYEIGGPRRGPRVALVHGFSTPLFTWDAVFDGLTRAGFRVLRYDLYGRGMSARPSDIDYDLDLYDQQLVGLLEAVGWDGEVHFAGLSMGGAIVVEFAARRPDRVTSLTLFDPAGFPIEMPFGAKLIRIPMLGEYLMRVAGDAAIRDNLRTNFFDQSLTPAFTERFLPQMKIHGFKQAQLSTMRHMPLGSMQERYREIGRTNIPVLLFWGREDAVVPYANAALIQEAVPQARLVTIDRCGHTPNYEKPGAVLPPMIAFLGGGCVGCET